MGTFAANQLKAVVFKKKKKPTDIRSQGNQNEAQAHDGIRES